MLYMLRCAKHSSNSNSQFRTSNSCTFLPHQKSLHNTSKGITYFPSSTWGYTPSFPSVPTISTPTRTRECAPERALLCGPPAAGAEVTRAKATRHGGCSADMASRPFHLSNGFVLHSVTIIPNVKLQGISFSKYFSVKATISVFIFSFPISLELKPEIMEASQSLKNNPLPSKHHALQQSLPSSAIHIFFGYF